MSHRCCVASRRWERHCDFVWFCAKKKSRRYLRFCDRNAAKKERKKERCNSVKRNCRFVKEIINRVHFPPSYESSELSESPRARTEYVSKGRSITESRSDDAVITVFDLFWTFQAIWSFPVITVHRGLPQTTRTLPIPCSTHRRQRISD